jgi:hypothetical protein
MKERVCFMSCLNLFPNFYWLQYGGQITTMFLRHFQYGVFNNAVSNSVYVAPNENNELEGIWKEVMDLCGVLPQHLPGGTGKHGRPWSEYLVSGQRFEPRHAIFTGTIVEFA